MYNKRLLCVLIISAILLSIFCTSCDTKKNDHSSGNTENTNSSVTNEDKVPNNDSNTTNNNIGSRGLAFQPLSGGACMIIGIGSCIDTNIDIPKYIDGYEVTGIGAKAFANCSSFTNITLSDSIVTIGAEAFADCDQLTSINIPDGIISIGAEAFTRCDSLKTVTILTGITSLEHRTFAACYNLRDITIPNTITRIAAEVFSGCVDLKRIHFQGTKAQWNGIAKDTNWDGNADFYEVICEDGTISYTH